MAKWRTIRVSELGNVITGKTPPTVRTELFGIDYPFITPTDIDAALRNVTTERFLSKDGCAFQRNLLLPSGAICFVSIGATIGKTCITSQPSFTNQQINSIIVDASQNDARFVYYLLRHEAENIKGIAGGAATPIVNKSSFAGYRVTVPELETQKKIGSLLYVYDDLIENNMRRIQILEQMAQTIYREWFVHFRFPGHAQVKLVASPLGRIPEGWACRTVNDLLSLKSGFAFKSSTFEEEGTYGLVTIKNVHDGLFVPDCTSRIAELPSNMPSFCHLTTGDVLLSLTGNIGRACLVYGERYLLNQRVAKLVPHQSSNRAYTYFTLRQDEFQKKLTQIANGVAQQNLSPVETSRMQVVFPSPKVLADFAEICEPIVGQMLVLLRKNANLRCTRDQLLPRLISGELSVENMWGNT